METEVKPILELPEHFPSLSACLAKCIKYKRKAEPGPAAARGTRVHHYIHIVLTGQIPFEQVPRSYQKQVAKAIECAMGIGGELLLAEEEIYAQIGEFPVPCTPDFVLKTVDGIVSINWKTGSDRDYKLPQRFYTVALCQLYNVDQVTIVECYVDLGYAKSYIFEKSNSLDAAPTIVMEFLSRDTASPRACEYCRWCALGPTGDRSCDTGCAQLSRV
jgi:hypothetical protein